MITEFKNLIKFILYAEDVLILVVELKTQEKLSDQSRQFKKLGINLFGVSNSLDY